MSQPANQPAGKVDMRQQMPETAKFVEEKRREYGTEFVNACIRRALKGEGGYFYAMERGHVLGTPFPATSPVHHWQSHAVAAGVSFAAFIVEPLAKGGTDGAH